MYIDLRVNEPAEILFDQEIALGGLQTGSGDEISVERARLRGRALRESHGVDLSARLEGAVSLPCSRCLEPFRVEIATDVELILVPDAVEFGIGESEMDPRSSLLFYAEEGRVELAAIAREQIYLQIPLKPLCRPDCRGLCPTCGVDRNRLECACRTEEPDPRLAPLLEIRRKLGRDGPGKG